MATPSYSSTDAAVAAMKADLGDARRVFITQAPDSEDRFHDQRDEEAIQALRNPNPQHSHVLSAWNSFQHNDPTPDLEACAMPPITHGGITHRLNRLAGGKLIPRVASPLPTGTTVRSRGRGRGRGHGHGHGRGSRSVGTDAAVPRTRQDAQNTHTSGIGSKDTSGQNHYAANQFNYLPRLGLLTSDNSPTRPNHHAEPAAAPSGPSPHHRRHNRRGSSAGSRVQRVRPSTSANAQSLTRATRPTGDLASPEAFMAAVRTTRNLDAAPLNLGHSGPAAEGLQKRPTLYPGVAERPTLSPSTTERGSALLHAEDPTESTAILSVSDSGVNGNTADNCGPRDNGTGNSNGGNTGNSSNNGNSTGSGKDDNSAGSNFNDMNDNDLQIASKRLNAVISRVEAFLEVLRARTRQPPETLPALHRHDTEALHVDAHREDISSEDAHNGEHENEPRSKGLWDSKWAPRD